MSDAEAPSGEVALQAKPRIEVEADYVVNSFGDYLLKSEYDLLTPEQKREFREGWR